MATTPLIDKMRRDAALYTPLRVLLGSSPFRWYDAPLRQGSAMPAIDQQQISNPTSYTAEHRLATSYSREQLTIWGGTFAAGKQAMWDVLAALKAFLDQWSGGTGIPGLLQYPNFVVNQRQFNFVQADTPIYRLVADVKVFSDDRLL